MTEAENAAKKESRWLWAGWFLALAGFALADSGHDDAGFVVAGLSLLCGLAALLTGR